MLNCRILEFNEEKSNWGGEGSGTMQGAGDRSVGVVTLEDKRRALQTAIERMGFSPDTEEVLKSQGIQTLVDLVKVQNTSSLWERLCRGDLTRLNKFLRQMGLHRWMSEQEVNALLLQQG